MGILDSIFGTKTDQGLSKATQQANKFLGATQDVNNQFLQDRASNASSDLTNGTNSALSELVNRYGSGNQYLQQYGGQALSTIQQAAKDAGITAQSGSGLYQPYYDQGSNANSMLGNALGLNGASGNAAATGAFQAGPGYQWQVDQATDAAARKAASLGMAASGNTLDAITRLGSNLANQEYGSWLDRLTGQANTGLTAAGAINGNNQAAAGYQYGAGTAGAGILSQLGSGLNTNATGLGNNLATLDNGLGTNLANVQTNLGNAVVNNQNGAAGAIAGNLTQLGAAKDATSNANNSIFSNLLIGSPKPGGSGALGSLLSAFKL